MTLARVPNRFRIFGRNPDVDIASVPEDVIPQGGVYAFPAAAAVANAISSSIEDAAGQTGALTIGVWWLDANYALHYDVVTMNGTTQVSNIFNGAAVLRVLLAEVLTAGSVGLNVGNIDIRHTATILAQIPGAVAGGVGRSSGGVFTIPARIQARVERWMMQASAAATAYLQVRPFGAAWTSHGVAFAGAGSSPELIGGLPLVVPARADVRVRVQTSAGDDTRVATDVAFLFEGTSIGGFNG